MIKQKVIKPAICQYHYITKFKKKNAKQLIKKIDQIKKTIT